MSIATVKYKQFLFLLISILHCSSTYGQAGFTGTVVGGLNTSQIDGDALAGYSKLGWTAGLKIGYSIMQKSDLSLELLLNQKGSNSGFGFGSSNEKYTNLNYVDFPIVINYKDWYKKDEDYYKTSLHAGLSTGYLISVNSTNSEYEDIVDNYNRLEFSYLIGASIYFTKHVGFTVRYTRAMNSMLPKDPVSGNRIRAISYFWTLRSEYKF